MRTSWWYHFGRKMKSLSHSEGVKDIPSFTGEGSKDIPYEKEGEEEVDAINGSKDIPSPLTGEG